jgi:hypothetical protein
MILGRTAGATIVTALLTLGAFGCSSSGETAGTENGSSALIGGAAAGDWALPSTVEIAGACTAAKVGGRFLLTAAHCAVNPSTMAPKYGPDQPLAIGKVEHAVAKVHAHPDWIAKCAETLCSISAVAAKVDAPDIAVIELTSELLEVPITPVDRKRVVTGEEVTLVGFGCTDGVHVAATGSGTLRTADATIVDPSTALHDGSPVTADVVSVFAENYVLTAGPGKDPSLAGLCPGDSGGPLYARRGGKIVVVGVNANYTLMPDEVESAGLPVTNWHTRVDDASSHGVFAWIERITGSE